MLPASDTMTFKMIELQGSVTQEEMMYDWIEEFMNQVIYEMMKESEKNLSESTCPNKDNRSSDCNIDELTFHRVGDK